jgi:hypothetical protein
MLFFALSPNIPMIMSSRVTVHCGLWGTGAGEVMEYDIKLFLHWCVEQNFEF